jgi:hypothetical protein
MKPIPFTIRHSLLTLILILTLSPQGRSQSETQPSPTVHIVWLTNGDTLQSRLFRIKTSDSAEKYLLLDNDRKIPIHQVSRFQGTHANYVVLPGSAGTDVYKEEKSGPRISTYSRILYEAPLDTNGNHPVAYYFRKEGQQQMTPMSFQALNYAMADNPDAQQQVQLTRSLLVTGLSVTAASAILGIIGILASHSRPQPPLAQITPTTPVINPFGPPLAPTPPSLPPLPKPYISPLVYVGVGGMLAGLTITLTAKSHQNKAFDIYNQ